MAGPSSLKVNDIDLSREKEQKELLRLAAPIIALGIPDTVFNREVIINHGFKYKKFVKLLKYVSSLNDPETILEAICLGLKHNFFILPNECDIKGFVAFARFLMSKEGRDALRGFRKEKNLLERISDKEEEALLAVLHAQRHEWLTARRTVKEFYEKKIGRLQTEIERLEQLRDNED